ncbi:MAG: GrpB family protein [Chitinispirillaceae bacterium]|nr:GrpB family protein [Chitinispirillaceae bacterium]
MPPKPLDQLSPAELGRLFPIFLSNYDPRWPRRYMREKARIEATLDPGTISKITHIGSTSVPGLISKPTIDILLEIARTTDLQKLTASITGIGYHFIPKPENPPPYMMFVKGYTQEGFRGQAFHLHVRYGGDWDEPYFCDYLRKHPRIASEYVELKKKLAEPYCHDRDGYTEAKTEFIRRVTALSKADGVGK